MIEFENRTALSIKKLITGIDDQGVDLLHQMLSYNPTQRPSAEECLQHDFLKGEFDTGRLAKMMEDMR